MVIAREKDPHAQEQAQPSMQRTLTRAAGHLPHVPTFRMCQPLGIERRDEPHGNDTQGCGQAASTGCQAHESRRNGAHAATWRGLRNEGQQSVRQSAVERLSATEQCSDAMVAKARHK